MNSIKQAIILALTSDKYSQEFSDIGSLIGEAIAANAIGEECYTVDDFLHGFKHGVSLVDGTHDEPLNNQKYMIPSFIGKDGIVYITGRTDYKALYEIVMAGGLVKVWLIFNDAKPNEMKEAILKKIPGYISANGVLSKLDYDSFEKFCNYRKIIY